MAQKIFVNSFTVLGTTVYTSRVVDLETGEVLAANKSTNKKQADLQFSKLKGNYPGSSIDNKTNLSGQSALKPEQPKEVAAPKPTPPSPEDPKDPPPPPPQPAPTPLDQSGAPAADSSPAASAGIASKSSDNPKFKLELPTAKLTKKARDLTGVSKKRKEKYEKLTEKEKAEKKMSGVFGTKRLQAMTKREDNDCELVLGRGPDNNAFIIIGNDRVSKPHTGYGGKGHTQCDSIDLVVGMGGHTPREVDKEEQEVKTNPNFFIDSARIYISQKTDVDKNFGIGEFGRAEEDEQDNKDDKGIGKYGAKSAIAVKADNIRIIGRESIRLVTGTDSQNSQGGDVLSKSGIEIVAMNKTNELQPMVLGDNLQELLITIVDNISAVSKVLHGYTKYQMKMNQALQSHTHLSPFFALPTTISQQAMAGGIKSDIETSMKTELSVIKQLTNAQGIKHNYLTESGENFINSRLNKVN